MNYFNLDEKGLRALRRSKSVNNAQAVIASTLGVVAAFQVFALLFGKMVPVVITELKAKIMLHLDFVIKNTITAIKAGDKSAQLKLSSLRSVKALIPEMFNKIDNKIGPTLQVIGLALIGFTIALVLIGLGLSISLFSMEYRQKYINAQLPQLIVMSSLQDNECNENGITDASMLSKKQAFKPYRFTRKAAIASLVCGFSLVVFVLAVTAITLVTVFVPNKIEVLLNNMIPSNNSNPIFMTTVRMLSSDFQCQLLLDDVKMATNIALITIAAVTFSLIVLSSLIMYASSKMKKVNMGVEGYFGVQGRSEQIRGVQGDRPMSINEDRQPPRANIKDLHCTEGHSGLELDVS